jgi:hypothetical protein
MDDYKENSARADDFSKEEKDNLKEIREESKIKLSPLENIELDEDEHRIKTAFKDRDWNEIKSSDSWAVFKVMAEFVEGFEKLAKIGPCVSIFGSARTKPGNKYYMDMVLLQEEDQELWKLQIKEPILKVGNQ